VTRTDLLQKFTDHVRCCGILSARDRCDETVERLRSVRTERYKYIRNFYPLRPHLQPNAYKDAKEIVRRLRDLQAQGELPTLAEKSLFAPTRPEEELYDVQADPHETRNLAADPKFKKALVQMRERLNRWMERTNDRGRRGEPAAMYDSDMAVYLNEINREREECLRTLRGNIALMKKWAAEGT
jgi:hypothetical protein